MSRRPLAALLVAVCLLAGACSGASARDRPLPLRLGYFANITHAPAIVGVEDGILAEALGGGVALETFTFNAGPQVIEAIFAGALDAAFVGPNPAVNGFAQSDGAALRIIAGAASGGAFLVVRDGINEAEDLRGTTLSTPQVGNTQDVALRTWLAERGLAADLTGGGDVRVQPQENAQIFETFRSGAIDGAWVPEPWASRLVLEAGGHVLVDERTLWPDGRYVTTNLVVRSAFLEQHPETVRRLLEGHVRAIDVLDAGPERARAVTNAGIVAIGGHALAPDVVAAAWANLEFTVDPLAASLVQCAHDAAALGFLDPVDLQGIYDLSKLNAVLAGLGRPPVEGL